MSLMLTDYQLGPVGRFVWKITLKFADKSAHRLQHVSNKLAGLDVFLLRSQETHLIKYYYLTWLSFSP